MINHNTEILVIGGGSTGTGVARDLAMRGFKTTLVERFGISEGTTRRYHGLLHSGGRYVVKDPEAAKECVQENRILRRIMPHAIDDTGGFFVVTPDDDPAFVEPFLSSSHECGLAVERVDVTQMLREEPSLNPKITHCFWVPDAVSYAYLSTSITARSAADHGATILTHHRVIDLLHDNGKISGVICQNARGEEVSIHADFVINATGPLAGKIAALADIPINIVPGKGTMVSIDSLPLRTVLNRCRIPSDGDIIVPKRGEAIVGTTDIEIEDPDQFGVSG
ncbi:MAG: FAD-dependent oxidoreductase, partial [Candidatus Promineifilaceae bacterium]